MLPTIRRFLAVLALVIATSFPATAAGVIPFALTQQIDASGRPLVGCLLNIYVVGTTATLQNVWGDFGLTVPLSNPLSCDATGRLPSFYLADGQVHVRLTDAGGLVLVDIPVLQVVGPSSGGGGGGGSVDPNAIASTGDMKFRPTSEILPGWVKLNQQTIGSATSGASGRANNDTQGLFIYLWNNCTQAHCQVLGGVRGASGLADFTANRQLTLPDFRSRMPLGRDQMDAATPAGRLLAANVTSGGGDGVDTAAATGGETNHTMLLTELVAHTHANTLTDNLHTHGISITSTNQSGDHHHAGGTLTTTVDGSHTHTTGGGAGQSFIANGPGGTNVAGGGGSFGLQAVVIDAAGLHSHGMASGITGGVDAPHTHNVVGTSAIPSGAPMSITNAAQGSGTPMPVVSPFVLGTWYIKL